MCSLPSLLMQNLVDISTLRCLSNGCETHCPIKGIVSCAELGNLDLYKLMTFVHDSEKGETRLSCRRTWKNNQFSTVVVCKPRTEKINNDPYDKVLRAFSFYIYILSSTEGVVFGPSFDNVAIKYHIQYCNNSGCLPWGEKEFDLMGTNFMMTREESMNTSIWAAGHNKYWRWGNCKELNVCSMCVPTVKRGSLWPRGFNPKTGKSLKTIFLQCKMKIFSFRHNLKYVTVKPCTWLVHVHVYQILASDFLPIVESLHSSFQRF